MNSRLLDFLERLFMPLTYEQRKRLDPITEDFANRMDRFKASEKVAEATARRDATETGRADAERGQAVLASLLPLLVVLARVDAPGGRRVREEGAR